MAGTAEIYGTAKGNGASLSQSAESVFCRSWVWKRLCLTASDCGMRRE